MLNETVTIKPISSLFYELMIDSYVHCLTSLTISNCKTIIVTCWLHNLHILWVSSPSSGTQAVVVVGQMEGGHIHPLHSEDTVLGGWRILIWANTLCPQKNLEVCFLAISQLLLGQISKVGRVLKFSESDIKTDLTFWIWLSRSWDIDKKQTSKFFCGHCVCTRNQ